MSRANLSPKEIANLLYCKGVRSQWPREYWGHDEHINAMAAMVKYVLRGPPKKKAKSKWQVWTPQMQAEEFDRERGLEKRKRGGG